MQQLSSGIDRDSLPSPPWLGILSNGPVWAAIAAQIGHDFGYYILVTDLPKYFHDVLNINTKENGFYASLPYLAMWICLIATGILADYLVSRNIIGLGLQRKLWTTIGKFLCSDLAT